MYPEWVSQHKQKGTNISCIGGRYYLYSVGSKWNREKGRAQKITKGYLGRITEEGLIPPKQKEPAAPPKPVTVKEYGAASVLEELGGEILESLRESFGKQGEMIFTAAAARVIEQCPFKRMENFYRNSYLSETMPGLEMSGKSLSGFLRDFGGNREGIVQFMDNSISESGHIIFDGTGIVSNSEKMDINRVGYNAHKDFDPQINLLYAFACDSKTPAYYRIVPGNIRDVSAMAMCLAETKLKDAVVVADKGFGSAANFEAMENANIRYIVPLKRNSSLFGTEKLKTGNKADFDGYFLFNERPIWYYVDNGIVVYLDNDLKNEEEKAYLKSIANEVDGYTQAGFMEKQYTFGIIALKSNSDKTPEEIYGLYKERRDIEQTFDFLKNLLEQDKTYMQNGKSLETWAFINHIALILNYKIYNLLREKKLLSNFSVADVLSHLKYIFKIKLNGDWVTSEYTKKTADLIRKLGLHIT